jgi:DNA-binding CsgD family transcriptional regulator
MGRERAGCAKRIGDSLPPIPLSDEHWRAVVKVMRLSPQQSRIVELVLRGAAQKQIVASLGISAPTLKTYLQRIAARTGTSGRMQLAMRVLAISREVDSSGDRRPRG